MLTRQKPNPHNTVIMRDKMREGQSGPCEDCGLPGIFRECPYTTDVMGKNTLFCLCDSCTDRRAQDI